MISRNASMNLFLGGAIALAFASCSFPTASQQSGDGEPPLSLSGKTQKLAFATDEGTWMSLDVTPDGAAIVFDLLGDLYRIPLTGGDAVPVTTGLGYDSQPSVSPDGQRVAFISDRDGSDNLWIAQIDGAEPRKLSSHAKATLVSPQWSPDGDYILVTEIGEKTNLTLYHHNGGGGVQLSAVGETPEINGAGGKFSPDGKSIYFAQPTEGGSYPGAQIRRFDRDTGAVVSITQGEGGGFRPVLSPDGRLLVYATRDEAQTRLRIRDLVGGDDRELIAGVQRDAQESGRIPSSDYLPGYDFTPDGTRLIVSFDGRFQSIDIATGKATPIAFNANVSLDIGPDLTSPFRVDQRPVAARIVHSPALSPDGSTIAASVLGKIYLMPASADEGEARRLTRAHDLEFNPVWSPDGASIAYVTWSDRMGGHVWRIASDGTSAPQRLTEHPAYYTDLDWSPDGERIVGMRGNEWTRSQTFSEFFGLSTPMEFFEMPSTGGGLRIIRPAKEEERDPHFGSDPDRIYANSGKALISMDFDGRDERTHLTVKGPKNANSEDDLFAEQIFVRPDGSGSWAVALVNGQVWVTPVPALGVKAPEIAVREPSLPAARLTDTGADFIGWSDDGAQVFWAIGSTVYRRPFDSIEFPVTKEGDESETRKNKSAPAPETHAAVVARDIAVTAPRATPSGAILLSGADIITMAGDETSDMVAGVENADILIVDNRIRAIGASGSLNAPADATVIDVTGKTIIPGLIDTHAHWEFRTQDVLEPHNWSLAANLAYGVTAGLDVQTSYKDYFTYRDFVDAGISIGQRAFMTGPGIFSNIDFQSYEETLRYLRRYSDHYETKNIKAYLSGNRKQRHWIIRASKELGLMPTTEGGADMRLNITHAIDGMHGNEHTLPVTPLRRDVIELYAKTQTAYTATLLVQYHAISAVNYFFTRFNPHNDEKLARFYPENRVDELTRRAGAWAIEEEFAFKEAAASVAALQRAGGLVGIGGHGELQGLGYHWEMQAHALGGMTPAEILRAATIDGARIIGIAQDLGSLEAGKLADLVVLNADPRDDITNAADILYVMKDGELYEGDTLTRIWPSRRELPPFWWTE